jgi:hypothetical protein
MKFSGRERERERERQRQRERHRERERDRDRDRETEKSGFLLGMWGMNATNLRLSNWSTQ